MMQGTLCKPYEPPENAEDFYRFIERSAYRQSSPEMKIVAAILLSEPDQTGLTRQELSDALRPDRRMKEDIITSTLEQMRKDGAVVCTTKMYRGTSTPAFVVANKDMKASLDGVLKIIKMFKVST